MSDTPAPDTSDEVERTTDVVDPLAQAKAAKPEKVTCTECGKKFEQTDGWFSRVDDKLVGVCVPCRPGFGKA